MACRALGWSEMSQFSVSAAGRHEEGAGVDHPLDRVVADHHPVLDAVDAGVEGGVHRLVAVGVGGDPQAATVGLVGDRRELLGGVLLRAGRTGGGHHTTRGAALDQLGAVGDLVADGLADLADPVGDALLDRHPHDPGGQPALGARVEVPAGRADGVAGRDDPRPLHPAGVDRVGEGDVDEVAAGLDEQPQVADRREAGVEGPLAVGHGPEAHLHGIQPDGVVQGRTLPAEDEVDLHVHEARHEGELGQVDHLVGPGGRRRVVRHGGDDVPLDDDARPLEHLAEVHIEDPLGAQDDDGLIRHVEVPSLMVRSRSPAPTARCRRSRPR